MMQSNIFAKVAPLLEGTKFKAKSPQLEKFFCYYQTGEFIYPAVMHRKIGLDISSVYELLEECVRQDILEPVLEIYCPFCQRFIGKRYKTIYDVPEEVCCIHCDQIINLPLGHAIVIYRVL